jgi:hypothetical protein
MRLGVYGLKAECDPWTGNVESGTLLELTESSDLIYQDRSRLDNLCQVASFSRCVTV